MKVLVPTDLDEHAKTVFAYANSLIHDFETKSKLELLHVFTPSLSSVSPIRGIIAEETSVSMHALKVKMEEMSASKVDVPCVCHVSKGEIVEEILEASTELKADLIVMSTHGASGLRKAIFGSNTANVITTSRIPVLAIPMNQRYKKIETIVYASDLKNVVSELKEVISFAKELNASIELFNIFEDQVDAAVKINEVKEEIKGLKYAKIKVIEQVYKPEFGVLEQIEAYIQKRKPELLVMFPLEKSWFDQLFASGKTEELAYNLKIPMMSIRK